VELLMQSRRAILVSGSRLLREIVRHVIENKMGFAVVRELSGAEELSTAILETKAEWIIFLVSSRHEISQAQRIELFANHQRLRIINLWADTGRIHMEWMEHTQAEFTGHTLDELSRFWAV